MKFSRKAIVVLLVCFSMFLLQGCGFTDKFFGKSDYQVETYGNGWKTLDLKGLYKIQYPAYLKLSYPNSIIFNKLKSASASRNVDYVKSLYGQRDSLILTSEDKTQDFAQVKILTNFSNKVPGLFDNVRMTPKQLEKYNETFARSVKERNLQALKLKGEATEIKYPVWNDVKIEYVNGINCLHHSYEMQVGDGVLLENHSYTFFNKIAPCFTLSRRDFICPYFILKKLDFLIFPYL